MKKWFAGIAVISLLVTAIPVQTEAAVKGEKKLPVLDSKTKKAYIKGTFDSKGRALFYFDAKTYLTDGTHLEFFQMPRKPSLPMNRSLITSDN
ncbi:hypothetical protein [Exiguobacterium artemiae]